VCPIPATLPTRPHPGAESTTANLITGPATAVADQVRDLIREASRRNSLVWRVTGGVDPLEFLHRSGEFAEAERPDLVLLDLNRPCLGGTHELLKL
jgi:hypothetical protein